MEINSKKNHLFCIRASFVMLLLAMCLTINVFFCSSYSFYEFLDKTTAIEPWDISEGIVVKGDGNNTTYSEASFESIPIQTRFSRYKPLNRRNMNEREDI